MTPGMRKVLTALQGQRIPLEDEKRAHHEIERVLVESELFLRVDREVRLANGVIDFMVDWNTGIEVKLKGNSGATQRQLRRYLEDEDVGSIVLVTAKAIGLPSLIRGKPVAVVDLAKAWL